MLLGGDSHFPCDLLSLAVAFEHLLCFVLNEAINKQHRVHFGIAAH